MTADLNQALSRHNRVSQNIATRRNGIELEVSGYLCSGPRRLTWCPRSGRSSSPRTACWPCATWTAPTWQPSWDRRRERPGPGAAAAAAGHEPAADRRCAPDRSDPERHHCAPERGNDPPGLGAGCSAASDESSHGTGDVTDIVSKPRHSRTGVSCTGSNLPPNARTRAGDKR